MTSRLASGALALACACLLTLSMYPTDARACGACVSPQPPPGSAEYPVLQNAERVLFYVDKDKSTIAWVEVRYQGLAENFGWVLPLPKQPEVSVGSTLVFDRLDDATAQRFVIKYDPKRENCHDPMDGCDPSSRPPWSGSSSGASSSSGGGMADAGTGSSSGGPNSGPDGVEVLDHGQTGPYDYVVVKGSDAKQLTDWLNKNKYITPKEALPIIDSHVKKGDVFLAIKLSNGQGVEAIKPVVLKMKDADPCVPLRLTSVAAVKDMSVVVTVAGPGRALLKNHLDVVPNPLKINMFKKGNNYPQVVSEAIDEAGGHAFVTEYSQPSNNLSIKLKSGLNEKGIEVATNVYDFAIAMFKTNKTWLGPGAVELIDKEAKLADLIPYKAKSAADALGWIWSCGSLWGNGGFGSNQPCNWKGAQLTIQSAKQTPFPGAKVAKALKEGIIDPVYAVADGMAAAKQVTRMVLRIDPQEMDRDPIFAFNTDGALGNVDNTYTVTWKRICEDGWKTTPKRMRMTWPGVGSYLINGQVGAGTSALTKPAKDAPWASSVTLQHESGKASPIDPTQYDAVDAAIAGAQPGSKSLPSDFKLKTAQVWDPPASDDELDFVGPWCPPTTWCIPKVGWVVGMIPPGYKGAGTGPGAKACPHSGAQPDGVSSSSSGGSSSSGSDSSSSSGGSSSSGSSSSSGGLDASASSSSSSSSGGSSSGGTKKADDSGCTSTTTGGHPATLLLLAMALIGLIIRRRRVV